MFNTLGGSGDSRGGVARRTKSLRFTYLAGAECLAPETRQCLTNSPRASSPRGCKKPAVSPLASSLNLVTPCRRWRTKTRCRHVVARVYSLRAHCSSTSAQ